MLINVMFPRMGEDECYSYSNVSEICLLDCEIAESDFSEVYKNQWAQMLSRMPACKSRSTP
jgi:hypothetical protein